MKIYFFKVSTLLIALSLMTLSCIDNKDNFTKDERLFISKWQEVATKIDGKMLNIEGKCSTKKDYWVCKLNNTMIKVKYSEKCIENTINLDWQLEDRILTISGIDNVGANFKEVYKILSIIEDEMTLLKKEESRKINGTWIETTSTKENILYLRRLEFLAGGGF